MDKEQIGFDTLVNVIGKDFIRKHKDGALFWYGEEAKGFHCAIGIDLHPETRRVTLSASIDDWDIYASCYVLDDGKVIMDKCRLPEEAGF